MEFPTNGCFTWGGYLSAGQDSGIEPLAASGESSERGGGPGKDSMNEGKLTINGDVNGDLHVGSMNRAHIYVNGRVTGGIITGSLSNGSGIQVTHGCGKATTADSLSGGSTITGSGCELGWSR